MSFSVIIPSANAANLERCIQAMLLCEPELDPRKIIVIDDGARANSRIQGVTWVTGITPFVFARNINLGILFCSNDVILLNDDALLQTPQGFSAMAEAAQDWGLLSAVNNCGNACQVQRSASGVREEQRQVPAFICVYIPRTTINAVGLLDERFTAYGFDDNDYVRRVRLAGLKVGIFDDCFVDHCSLPSTFRGAIPGAPGDIAAGRAIYLEKWGAGAE